MTDLAIVPENVTARLKAKGFASVSYVGGIGGNKFVVQDSANPPRFFQARLSKGGSGGVSAKVGKVPFISEAEALDRTRVAALNPVTVTPAPIPTPAVLTPVVTPDPKAAIAKHLESDRSLVTTHLYKDTFAVAKVSPARGWQFYVAKVTANGVEVLPGTYADRGAALVRVHRDGGTTPTLDLSSLPSRPLGLYS